MRFERSNARLITYVTTSASVRHMEMDRYKDGNILFSDSSPLKSTDSKITQTVAGRAGGYNYREGIGEAATFRTITGFYQISSSKVIVLDYSNHCLRLVDHIAGGTQTFSGTCTKSGFADGSQALFDYPYSIIPGKKNPYKLLITDRTNKAVRHVDVNTGAVTIFFKDETLNDPTGITQEVSSGDLYMTTFYAVYRLHYQSKELTIIAGSHTRKGYRDGDVSVSQFDDPKELLLIGEGRQMILADEDNRRLRIVCSGAPRHKDGDMSSCSLRPLSLTVSGNSLYIGEDRRIGKISGLSALHSMSFIISKGTDNDIYTLTATCKTISTTSI